jgi:hypothetical protein
VSSVMGLVAAGALALGPLAGGLLVEAVGGPGIVRLSRRLRGCNRDRRHARAVARHARTTRFGGNGGGHVILRNRGLLGLLAAGAVSRLGSQMTFLALPWFVLVTTGSPAKMGIALAVELAPVALLGVPSGTVVSRLGARTTMLASDLARVPLMTSLPILHAAGLL